ncbi:putative RNase H-like nuclease (RuvC/YqgF family) [Neobacillus niacini]|uniref:hypothetical protein n=1 Tax=Neobacillus niacini TaxID=86668 RepID=UPI00278AA016|nr:hypothetical protein [Neobacillus niacini]MDQ1000398.1 putative RNase H-like nuclease (RuvC/YqgF family) [Neobacillus niacini]
MGVISNLVVAASVTGVLTVGALTWNGSESLSAVKGYAESMKENVENLAGDISFLNTTISGKNGQIDHQKGRIGDLENTIATLTAEKEALQLELDKLTAENEKIPGLEAQITNLQAKITELETQTATLQSQLTSLQANYDRAIADLEKANGEIAKANQESQELKAYIATLEAETTSTYNTAKVDQTNPMYAVETPSSDPIASIRGLHWTSPLEAFYDNAVFNLLGELMQTEPVAGTGDDGVVDTYTVDAPVLNDGKMDALIEYIAKNSDLAADLPVLTLRFGNVHAADGESRHIYGGYILRADDATGQYVVEKF